LNRSTSSLIETVIDCWVNGCFCVRVVVVCCWCSQM
jgi:hypothetical protein